MRWRFFALLLGLALMGGLSLLPGCGGSPSGESSQPGGTTEREGSEPGSRPGSGPEVTPRGELGSAFTEPHELPPVRENEPPTAKLRVEPKVGWAGLTQFQFRADHSLDDRDSPSRLEKKWDLDGDGIWDGTRFRKTSSEVMVFEKPGRYRPRLLVRDSGGLVDSVVGEEIIVKDPCAGLDFDLVDVNPNSPTYNEHVRLSDFRGRRVILWYTTGHA